MRRRNFHRLGLASVFVWGNFLARGQSAALRPTPRDTEGPYYPEQWTGDIDEDLLVPGGAAQAQGQLLELIGLVRDTQGRNLAGAQVEIWQTDHTGRYRHSGDDGEKPLQRGFQGYGRTSTNAQGRYRFATLKPVAYGGRPPHIHFRVAALGQRTLTTQMYFANENTERGGLAGFSRERDALTVTPRSRTEAGRNTFLVTFDIVLAST